MSMRDAFLHIPMTALFWMVCAAVILIAPTVTAAAVIASLVTFFREVTQQQGRHRNDFRAGWNFWTWSVGKNLEWMLPGAVITAAGVLWDGI